MPNSGNMRKSITKPAQRYSHKQQLNFAIWLLAMFHGAHG